MKNNIETQIQNYKEAIKLDGDLKVFSDSSFDKFNKIGLPNRKVENWRFTPVKSMLEDNSTWKSKTDFSKPSQNTISIENGKINFDNLQLDNSIEVSNILDKPELIQLINSFGNKAENPFRELSNGFIQETLYLKITKDLSEPIRVVYSGDKSFALPKIIVETKANTSAQIYERFELTNSQIHSRIFFNLEANSHIQHIVATTGSIDSIINTDNQAKVSKDASYSNIAITLNGDLIRHNLQIELNEHNANCQSFGLYALKGEQHCDNSTFIHHAHEETYSEQLFKGILSEKSKGIFTGRILVDKQAQRIDSSQLNKTMLLSKFAQSHSQPQLEIFADDVKCSHGSTTGQLSPEEIFYFQSRGISKTRAHQILSYAFANEILLKIKDDTIREEISNELFSKFSELSLTEDK
jgi:Fe-S cluster assembly protein SufD